MIKALSLYGVIGVGLGGIGIVSLLSGFIGYKRSQKRNETLDKLNPSKSLSSKNQVESFDQTKQNQNKDKPSTQPLTTVANEGPTFSHTSSYRNSCFGFFNNKNDPQPQASIENLPLLLNTEEIQPESLKK